MGLRPTRGRFFLGVDIWFAGVIKEGSDMEKNMASMGKSPKSVRGTLGFEGGLQLDLGLSFADEAAAKEVLTQAQAMLPMAKGMMGPAAVIVDKVKMDAAGADMNIGLNLSEEELKMLSDTAGAMMGGM